VRCSPPLKTASLLLGLSALAASPALAWDNHTPAAHRAFAELPEVGDFPPVEVQSLSSFLQAEQQGLVELLADEEAWARQNVPTYPPLPDELAFVGGGGDDLQRRFLNALRVNPDIKLALYRKLAPEDQAPVDVQPLPWDAVTTLKNPGSLGNAVLLPLQEGERVPALEVLVAACDEPDYGFDLGLWSDNGTDYGALAGLGEQPFGNPVLEYSSQAPFHMGFYHEADIVYSLASFLQRTYPEYRLHMYQQLARYAFEQGHDYWGWRFAGWALHYVQDLTMPYHAQVLPGVSVTRMLGINILSVVGMSGPKDDAVQLVSNRHMALEIYVRQVLEVSAQQADSPLQAALADSAWDSHYGIFGEDYLRRTLTLESVGRSDQVDGALEEHMPEHVVSDPQVELQDSEDVLQGVRDKSADGEAALDSIMSELLRSFGAHSRNFLRALREGMPVPALEPEPAPDEQAPEGDEAEIPQEEGAVEGEEE